MEQPQKKWWWCSKKIGAAAGKKMVGGTGKAEAAPEPPEQVLRVLPEFSGSNPPIVSRHPTHNQNQYGAYGCRCEGFFFWSSSSPNSITD